MVRDRVLIVDDDPDLRELISMAVQDWGLTGVEARDCLEALSLIEQERGRLHTVLLDYFMPGMDPCACAKAICARVEPTVPVVLVSAAVDIAERAAQLQLTRFLSKPFDVAQLRREVLGEGS